MFNLINAGVSCSSNCVGNPHNVKVVVDNIPRLMESNVGQKLQHASPWNYIC